MRASYLVFAESKISQRQRKTRCKRKFTGNLNRAKVKQGKKKEKEAAACAYIAWILVNQRSRP